MAKDNTKSAQDRTQWAEDRTDWAEDRTILAAERTYASWLRTGLTCIAIALGLQAVFGAVQPLGLAKLVASIFLCAALGIFWNAYRRARATLKILQSRDATPQSTRTYTVMTIILMAGTLATGVVLWLL
ncbi:DUF202 domain-containing protein [Loktanella sp. SALINAS62]|uniref:YidH family protein n=1 Tax=Loktanella sp. SALINAS62 TaxID=2706124 RepID=UPI001B8DA317|nr:DUF202 domain-containing protein [Loktanella sp. SALINAS62]MBS1303075.1 DUF202 domain-containing protein [Loktanella sp. SALINAS62]